MPLNFDSYIDQIKKEDDIFIKARLLLTLKKDGFRTIEIARSLKLKSSYIDHLLRLNRLPEIIVDGYYSKLLTLSHLFIISRLKDETIMKNVYEQVLASGLTVTHTESLVRDALYGIKSDGHYIDSNLRQQKIANLKAKDKNVDVKIIQTRIKSKLILEKKGPLSMTSDWLIGLLNKLG